MSLPEKDHLMVDRDLCRSLEEAVIREELGESGHVSEVGKVSHVVLRSRRLRVPPSGRVPE